VGKKKEKRAERKIKERAPCTGRARCRLTPSYRKRKGEKGPKKGGTDVLRNTSTGESIVAERARARREGRERATKTAMVESLREKLRVIRHQAPD